jgi:hypothetical protein
MTISGSKRTLAITKLAQAMSSLSSLTLGDLYAEIQNDYRIAAQERLAIMQRIDDATHGAAYGTPLSSLMQRGLGGIIGSLISKYFGLGGVGQGAMTAAGFGLAPMIGRYLNPAPNPYPGYKML